MNPKQAQQSLEYILANQKTVSTSKIEILIRPILHYNNMLRKDNRKLRNKINRQRKANRRMENE